MNKIVSIMAVQGNDHNVLQLPKEWEKHWDTHRERTWSFFSLVFSFYISLYYSYVHYRSMDSGWNQNCDLLPISILLKVRVE